MEPNKSAIERAFELARSGTCKTVNEIKQKLREEGYNDDMIIGRSLWMQLRTLIAEALKK
jgi:hypothetical protein